MDDLRALRFVRLRLEALEDRFSPAVAAAFNNVLVADAASVNTTTQPTTPVVGVAADGSYVVAWQFPNPSTRNSQIYARQFNADGTAKSAAFAVTAATTIASQPAIAVAADGHFIIAYTEVVTAGTGSENDVFFQIFGANGARTLSETEVPAHTAAGTPNDFAPDVAVSNATGQFVIVWEQQSSTTNTTVYARAFQSDGSSLTVDDVAVATTAGLATKPHVAVQQASGNGVTGTFATVISYTLNEGSNLQQVFFRRYVSVLTPVDTADVGVSVSGNDTLEIEDDSALALDANNNLVIAWTATPVAGGPSQIRYQQFGNALAPQFFNLFNTVAVPVFGFAPFVDNNPAVNQSDTTLALNGNGHFLIAYVVTNVGSTSPTQTFFREFDATLQPVGTSRLFSSDANPNDASPRLASSGNGQFVIVADDLTASDPAAVARGFDLLTSRVGVVFATSTGLAEFALDSNGNETFDGKDSVFTFGFFSDQFVIGDWNGGGYDEVGVVRPNGPAAVWALDTNGDGVFEHTDQVFLFGRATDQFLIGDWNGSGTDKIAVVRPFNATAIFSLDTNGDGKYDSGDQVFQFGLASDTFVVGDWNGSGTTKIGVVRPDANGNLVWSLDTNGDGTFNAGDTVTTFGLATDVPLVGDWTGSGKSEIGVVRTNFQGGTATFLLDTNGDGVLDSGDATFTFGLANDKFIVGKWKPTSQPQFAALPGPGGAAPLTDAQLAATVQLAIQDWTAAGLNAQQVNQLEHVQFHIAQLNDNLLGLTEGNSIDISDNADGWGWNTSAGNPPSNRMDLLSTVSHELGHILGLKDSSNLNDVMGDILAPGTRRLPTTADVDTVFAQMGTYPLLLN